MNVSVDYGQWTDLMDVCLTVNCQCICNCNEMIISVRQYAVCQSMSMSMFDECLIRYE